MAKIEKFDDESKKINLKWILIFFTIALSFLAYGIFSENIPLTGNIIKDTNFSDGTEINAKLGVPDLSLNGDYKEITITKPRNSLLYVGNAKFDLKTNTENKIIIQDFRGKINFNSKSIPKLEGKSSKVTINGVSILPESGNTTKIRLEGETFYESLSIKDNLIIEELTYTTSGLLELKSSNDILTIQNKEITIKDFKGSITSQANNFNITGKVLELEIKSDNKILIKSK